MILRIILLYIFFYNQLCHSAESATLDGFVCVPGLLTWGVTSPRGDIMLEAGSTLEVNCTIDLSHPKVKGRTSKDIQFSVGKHEIRDELLEKRILDEGTAMLRVKNMNVSTPLVHCFLENPNTHVCENQVDVGYPPLPVENLKCVARDWGSLNCTWTKPRNNIWTSYNISYRFREFLMECPNKVSLSKVTESCEWNGRTHPHYRQNMKAFVIVMTGTNYLKPQGIRWNYEFHNWEIVIPSAPERLSVEAVSPHEIDVRWSFINFQLFTPGLNHRVTICPITPIHNCIITDFKSKDVANLTRRFEVPYANMEYRIEIRMKSQVANDTEEFWSPPSIHPSIRTLPKRPEFPPRTGIGTFEIFNKYQLRDITIYWEKIPIMLQNGSDFHYDFKVFEENQLRRDIVPEMRKGKEFAFFANLSLSAYTFEIRSVNSEGESLEKGIIHVARSGETPKEPRSVSKVDYTNGTYEISWQRPSDARDDSITSYTVYRCHGSKVECDELLEWIDVVPSTTHYIFHGLDSLLGRNVFGVSANSKVASSGMVVATCELIHNKIPGKLKEVSVLSWDEKSIEIKWGMDCSFKPGLVNGFRITYCRVEHQESCSNLSQRTDLLVSGNVTSWRINDLVPYSDYLIWVSMVTRAGESQSSDPIRVNTTEAAPSDPPQVTRITTTNSSVLLGIQNPIKANGVIQRYEIFYDPLDNNSPGDKTEFQSIGIKDLEMGDNSTYYYNLTNLESNTNYSLRVAACTIHCSNLSETLLFQTEFGYTTLTATPLLTYKEGKMWISWKSPNHVGGPIEYFELLVEKNGELGEPRAISYDPRRSTYLEEMDLKCDTSTNVTARVRAISFIGSEQLFGNWSPEGSFNCYGSDAWFIWILILIASLISFVMITFASVKCWRKIKIMHTLDVVAPPGMEQLQLNGFSERHGRRIRQNSEGDTQPFRKDNLISQSTGYQSPEYADTKDFMSSDSKENGKGGGDKGSLDVNSRNGSPGGRGVTHGNGELGSDKCPIWLWKESAMMVDKQGPPDTTNPLSQPSLPGQTPNSDELLEKGPSPSPSNPLMSDSSPSNSGDEDDHGHYRTLNFEPDESLYNPGESHPTPPPMSNGEGPGDESGHGNSQPLPNGSITDLLVPELSKNSAYVKWTSLKLDPILGPSPVTLNGKAPYCQVGILLEQ